ncbi:MAG TPA: presenilin family intramembrane aspartyl protease PSH [Thermoplasmata archaeon]|nr:presenilin family intramembrane aspartyl protease PSH [Thermoplasmata archaeon]
MRSLRSFGLVSLFIGAQVVALALALPFRAQGLSTTANPSSPTAPLYLIAVIIAAPIGILLLARIRGALATLRWIILLGIAGALSFTLTAAFQALLPEYYFLPPVSADYVVVPAIALGMLAAVLMFEVLLLDPQWYVVDFVGFVAAGSLIALLGISFAILPVLILLVVLAGYDAIAVYWTKHMVSLAEVVTDLKLPILLVMPATAGYNYPTSGGFTAQRGRPVEEREAMFMGLGDIVFPGILIVAAYIWLPLSPTFLHVGANLWVALGALAGALVGYTVLMRFVHSGNPQAGLPFLNGGVIAGYLLTYLLVLHNLSFGVSFNF